MNSHKATSSGEGTASRSTADGSGIRAGETASSSSEPLGDCLASDNRRLSRSRIIKSQRHASGRLVNLAVEMAGQPTVQVIDETKPIPRHGSRTAWLPSVAEVGLDHVGITRHWFSADWPARTRTGSATDRTLCDLRTLLADHDGLYDPTAYNDRLLLGLRGMMSEAELHILQGRMYEALPYNARARRDQASQGGIRHRCR